MHDIMLGLQLMGYGLGGVFATLFLLYFVIRGLVAVFKEKGGE